MPRDAPRCSNRSITRSPGIWHDRRRSKERCKTFTGWKPKPELRDEKQDLWRSHRRRFDRRRAASAESTRRSDSDSKGKRRTVAEDSDRQTIRHRSRHGLQHGALPERVAGQLGADPDPRGNHGTDPARDGEAEQAGAGGAPEREAFYRDGGPDQWAGGRRRKRTG